jgi:hypothetical protein
MVVLDSIEIDAAEWDQAPNGAVAKTVKVHVATLDTGLELTSM